MTRFIRSIVFATLVALAGASFAPSVDAKAYISERDMGKGRVYFAVITDVPRLTLEGRVSFRPDTFEVPLENWGVTESSLNTLLPELLQEMTTEHLNKVPTDIQIELQKEKESPGSSGIVVVRIHTQKGPALYFVPRGTYDDLLGQVEVEVARMVQTGDQSAELTSTLERLLSSN
jgi:hypothetical protein